MAVYVDRLFECEGRVTTWPWSLACHMYADSIEELHEFAQRLGLNRAWFQDRKYFPHYDLSVNKRVLAVRLGAVEADRAHVWEFCRKTRESYKETQT